MGSHDAALQGSADAGAIFTEVLIRGAVLLVTLIVAKYFMPHFAGDLDELLKLHVKEAVRSKLQQGARKHAPYNRCGAVTVEHLCLTTPLSVTRCTRSSFPDGCSQCTVRDVKQAHRG